jgi:hypothetical protein
MFSCNNQLFLTCTGRWCHVAQIQLVINCNDPVEKQKSSTIKSSFFWDVTQRRLPTFRDKISVPTSRVKLSKMGTIACSKTSVTNYQSTLRTIPDKDLIYTAKEACNHACVLLCYCAPVSSVILDCLLLLGPVSVGPRLHVLVCYKRQSDVYRLTR